MKHNFGWTSLVLVLALAAGSTARAAQLDIPGPATPGLFGKKVTVLPNGNFVVTDPNYSIPAGAAGVGAAYLYGPTGTLISTLTGSTANDHVGAGVTVLSNGNYLVVSTVWNNGGATTAGAVTWGSMTAGVSGTVSAANSLVGSTTNDAVGLTSITPLSNGHYVVVSVNWSGTKGAATWGNGTTGTSGVINSSNSLVGSTAGDQVGFYGLTELSNGNYVVASATWTDVGNSTANAGAVTWGSGTSGISGVITSANSLVGVSAGDKIGFNGVAALSNGNYVVSSSYWKNGAYPNAGAVTWCNGVSGTIGTVTGANSLVGSFANDLVGSISVTPISNGTFHNYVVNSPSWANGASTGAGAVTWCDGSKLTSAPVTSVNSLVGSTTGDAVGSYGVTALGNGNYVVSSASWNNGGSIPTAGAVTWGDGSTGSTFGTVSSSNSLVGSTAGDQVGSGFATSLSNSNYVVCSPSWNNGGSVVAAGAVTWGNGTTGISGVITSGNSLVGSTLNDHVGSGGVKPVSNGTFHNYVVSSPLWTNPIGPVASVGAVTWGNGSTGVSGAVSAANSLVGSTANDQVGNLSVMMLTNGNYVVDSYFWANGGATHAGAVTWGNGSTGIFGAVTAANSLVGTTMSDFVGGIGVFPLSNGNYVVASNAWHNGATAGAGAVTWGNGTTGLSGAVTAANSLVGTTLNDSVGGFGVTPLSNGHYVVASGSWNNGATVGAGAVTWGNGSSGITGAVTAANSLVGSTANDQVGSDYVTEVSDGNYTVFSSLWNNGATLSAGAISLGVGATGTVGVVNASNSVRGITAAGGVNLSYDYDGINHQLVVGRPADNIVTIFASIPPTITSNPLTASGTVGVPFNFTILTSGSPTITVTASPLPAGLSLTGAVISGTPTTPGVTNVVLTASNGTMPNDSKTLVITVPSTSTAPVIASSSLTASGTVGVPFNFTILVSGSQPIAIFTVSALPAGLSLDAISGIISGTPTTAGVTNMDLTASNGTLPNDSKTLVITISAPPVITSLLTASGVKGSAFSYPITASGSTPITYTASPLPAGLTFVGNTISGTPTTAGVTNVTLTASNGTLPNDTKTLVLTVTAPPVIASSSLTASGTVGVPFNFTILVSGSQPIAIFTVSALPAGLSLDAISGIISGTPTTAGVTNMDLTASNGIAPNDSKVLVITISAPPVITSLLTASGVKGSAFSYPMTASGSTPITYTASPLPAGLTFVGNTISGTPTTEGVTNVTLTASNGTLPNDTKTLVLTVTAPPVITSLLTASGVKGSAFNYTITASGSPTITYTVSPLPAGLSFNAISGIIFGTPTVAGSTNVTLTANNGTLPNDSKTLVITVIATPPLITSPLAVSGVTGTLFNYTLTASGSPTIAYTTSLLPSGLTLTGNTISGTPTTDGVTNVTLTASNGTMTDDTQILVITVTTAPIITSSLAVSGVTGTLFNYTLTASGSTPIAFTVSPLPAGLTLLGATISGTPTTAGVTNVTLTASNGALFNDSKTLVITVTAAPLITSALTDNGIVGTPYSYTITASGSTPITFTVSTLPAGLTLAGNTISGNPTTAGVTNVTLKASNGTLPDDSRILVITVTATPPTITSALTASALTTKPFSYTLTASGSPTITYTATPLPAGLSLVGNTITGIPTAAGVTNVTLIATNGTLPDDNQTLVITVVALTGPVINSALTAGGTVNVPFSYKITASSLTPVTYTATTLPPGLTFSVDTISGTPTTLGATNVTLTASNGTLPDDKKTLVITIYAPNIPPTINSTLSAIGIVGTAFKYVITASGSTPITFTTTTLPAGLTLTGDSISGTPTTTGTTSVTLTASNGLLPNDSKTLVLSINPPLPIITSKGTATGLKDVPFSYTITASNTPTSYDAVGLPAGLLRSTSTGVISGTPIATGVSTITLSATNSTGTSSTALVLTINPQTPVITSSLTVSGFKGVPFSYTITAANTPASFSAVGLPAWLSLSTTTGVISGTPPATGTSNITLKAINVTGTGSAELLLSVGLPPPPVLNSVSILPSPAKAGSPVSMVVTASDPNNLPLTATWDFGDGTPVGIGGTVNHTYTTASDITVTVTVTVSNGYTQSVLSGTLEVVAPNSGGMGISNVFSPPVLNPVNGISVGVQSSDGGVVVLGLDIDTLLNRALYDVSTDFTDIGARGATNVKGLTPVHKFTQSGVFVATIRVKSTSTGAVLGMARKTLAISGPETGEQDTFGSRSSTKLGGFQIKGRFSFPKPKKVTKEGTLEQTQTDAEASTASKDTVTMSGSVELPSGLALNKDMPVAIGIGNVAANGTANSRGLVAVSSGSQVKKFQITYPKVDKVTGLTKAGAVAKFTVTMSSASLTTDGFDTEGITANVAKKQKLPRKIQIALVINGVSYSDTMSVNYTLASDTVGQFDGLSRVAK